MVIICLNKTYEHTSSDVAKQIMVTNVGSYRGFQIFQTYALRFLHK